MSNAKKDADILLVEDNPGDAKLVMMAFKKCNPDKNILWMNDGEKALDYLLTDPGFIAHKESKKPFMVLLDLTLPKMSGFDVLKKIKENKETREVEIVVLTGSQRESDLVTSYGFGVKSYIRKQIACENCVKVICGEGREKEINRILKDAYGE